VDLNKNCSKYTQGKVDSDNVEIRIIATDDVIMTSYLSG